MWTVSVTEKDNITGEISDHFKLEFTGDTYLYAESFILKDLSVPHYSSIPRNISIAVR